LPKISGPLEFLRNGTWEDLFPNPGAFRLPSARTFEKGLDLAFWRGDYADLASQDFLQLAQFLQTCSEGVIARFSSWSVRIRTAAFSKMDGRSKERAGRANLVIANAQDGHCIDA
jgi:hypothetical protein